MALGYHAFLALGMVVTGSLNTLSTKLADVTEAEGLDGDKTEFNHPFVQALGMFLGEFSCLLVFKLLMYRERKQRRVQNEFVDNEPKQQFSPIIFLLPALCDLTATSLMYLGLTMTYASVFQMLRGSVVIFTGALSVIFLKRKLMPFHWLGMFLILSGLAFVGVASVVSGGGGKNAPNPLLGDIFVIIAQVIVAVQMVVEEKLIGKYDVPALQAVGWEGAFGCAVMSMLLVMFQFIPGSSAGGVFENTADAVFQLGSSPVVLIATLGNFFSIAFFNFFGISVTKEMSATTRMVLDSVRTFVIWGVSMLIGWQDFQYLQVIGFVILLAGTCVYNKIVRIPKMRYDEPVQEKLLDDSGNAYVSDWPVAEEEM